MVGDAVLNLVERELNAKTLDLEKSVNKPFFEKVSMSVEHRKRCE